MLIVVLLALLFAWGSADASIGSATSVSDPGPAARVLEVCPSGCRFTVACGATCSSATSTCAAGSAYEAAEALNTDPNTPVNIHLGPGTYRECIAIDEPDINIVCDPGAIIEPVIADADPNTNSDAVSGGVVRFGPDPNTTARSVRRNGIYGPCQIYNHDWSSPEAGVQVGPESGTASGLPATWTDITIGNDVVIYGNHDGLQWYGSNDPNDTDLPRIYIYAPKVVSGADACAQKGYVDRDRSFIQLDCRSISNGCETTDTTITNAITGTVAAVGGTATFKVETADTALPADSITNRKFNFGGASCPSTTDDHWITTFSTATDIASFTPADANAPDPNCTYNIVAVSNPNQACTRADWSQFRSTATTALWKETAFHMGQSSNAIAPAPAADGIIIRSGSNLSVQANEGMSTTAGAVCSGQQFVAGALFGYLAKATERIVVEPGVSVEVDVNYDVIDSADPNCPRILGVGMGGGATGTQIEDFAEFNGSIRIDNEDPDASVAGLWVFAADPNEAQTLRAPDVSIDINNTAGGYSGTSAHVWSVGADSTVQLGQIVSDAAITQNITTGVYGYLSGTSLCEHQYTVNFNPDESADAYVSLTSKELTGCNTPAAPCGDADQDATETNVDDTITPFPLYFKDMKVTTDVAPGGTDIWAVTLRDDAGNTAVTCSFTSTDTSCSYTGSQVLVAAGSKIDLFIDQTASPTAAAEMLISLCASP